MPEAKEVRPAGNGTDLEKRCVGSAPAAKSIGSAGVEAALSRGDMALLVVTGLRNGGVRRRVVFTIGAALRALELADRRGVPASVALVRLQPVERVDLDDGGDHD